MEQHTKSPAKSSCLVKMASLEPNSTMARAYLLMAKHRCPTLPIKSEGEVVGVISERDIEAFVNSYSSSMNEGASKVIHFMKGPVTSVEHDSTVATIAKTMLDERVSAVLIKRGEDVIGALTKDDLLEVLADLLKHSSHNLMDGLKAINQAYLDRSQAKT